MLAARLVTAATLVVALGIGSQARADIATEWNATAMEATVVPANSILQSRVLAIMHVAMYDAARVSNQKPALLVGNVEPDGPSSPRRRWRPLPMLFSNASRRPASGAIDVAYKSALSTIAEGPPKANGVKLGQSVAERLLELRATDGSTQKVDVKLSNGPGSDRANPATHSMQPILPQWGAVRPFAIHLEDGFETKGPPRLESPQFKTDFDEVKLLGARQSTARTADQTAAAVF